MDGANLHVAPLLASAAQRLGDSMYSMRLWGASSAAAHDAGMLLRLLAHVWPDRKPPQQPVPLILAAEATAAGLDGLAGRCACPATPYPATPCPATPRQCCARKHGSYLATSSARAELACGCSEVGAGLSAGCLPGRQQPCGAAKPGIRDPTIRGQAAAGESSLQCSHLFGRGLEGQ